MARLNKRQHNRRSAGAWAATQVIGGGGDITNGFGAEGYFIAGDAVAPTSFFSSGYDAQYHTAEGLVSPSGGVEYAPQLSQAVRDLLEQSCTIVIDGEIADVGADTSQFYLAVDESVFFFYGCDTSSIMGSDGNGDISGANVGVGNPPVPGRYRLAITRRNDETAYSVNGSAAFLKTGGPGDNPVPSGDIAVAILSVRYGGKVAEFTVMSPVADSELPALSAL